MSDPGDAMKEADRNLLAIQAQKALRQINDGPEESHMNADGILVKFVHDLGYHTVADAYEECEKRNTFWYA